MNVLPGTTRWFSLRRRLLALLLGGVTAGWLATLAFSYADAHREIDEIFDAQLVQVAQTLLAMAGEYDEDEVARLEYSGHKYHKQLRFQLWDDQDRLLLRSPQTPATPLAMADGFSESPMDENERWRYYSQWDKEHQLRVQVGENHDLRQDLARHIAGRLLVPALFGLPLLGLWVFFATRRGLAPIDAVTREVVSRAPGHLAALTPVEAPTEIRPLLDALNGLFVRVEQAMENERSFTADAAHELRTPLAALATQAQVALRARDAVERDHALGQVVASARRASHLVDQLLTLARLDPAAGLPCGPVRLDQLAAELCADYGPAALEKNLVLELDAPQPATVSANEPMLRILLRNLIDNAVRYTPPGGKVGVTVGNPRGVGVTVAADGIMLAVADSGPGIPVEQRQAVLQRFHRLAGQETEGSGLGLAIVARIAELHGARMEMADGIGKAGLAGLSVRMTFVQY